MRFLGGRTVPPEHHGAVGEKWRQRWERDDLERSSSRDATTGASSDAPAFSSGTLEPAFHQPRRGRPFRCNQSLAGRSSEPSGVTVMPPRPPAPSSTGRGETGTSTRSSPSSRPTTRHRSAWRNVSAQPGPPPSSSSTREMRTSGSTGTPDASGVAPERAQVPWLRRRLIHRCRRRRVNRSTTATPTRTYVSHRTSTMELTTIAAMSTSHESAQTTGSFRLTNLIVNCIPLHARASSRSRRQSTSTGSPRRTRPGCATCMWIPNGSGSVVATSRR